MSRVIAPTDHRHKPFWSKVQWTDTCWLWTGSKHPSGYGLLTPLQRARTGERRAHRHSYTLINGPIPPGLQINHHCDTPACVRPDHLYAGTAADNIRDALQRDRGIGRRKRPMCPQGHEKIQYAGRLICQECKRIASRESFRRRTALPAERFRK